MSTLLAEPGLLLGGRYRLEDRYSDGRGWVAWKANDETLRRAVTALTFSSGFPRIADTLTAARAASRLSDARLARVFDLSDDQDHPYVVTEWAGGDSLDDLLADGALDPLHAAEIIARSAEALNCAHAANLAHLCLNPRSLRWTAAGLKVVGLGTDAALAGVTADDPAAIDAQSLGRLLYGALTACWPGGAWPSLPAAPETGGHPYRPRQIRAGVPTPLDQVCCRTLFPGDPGLPPVTTPAQLAAALAVIIPAPALSWRHVTAEVGIGRFAVTPPYDHRTASDAMPPFAARLLASITAVLLIAAVVWSRPRAWEYQDEPANEAPAPGPGDHRRRVPDRWVFPGSQRQERPVQLVAQPYPERFGAGVLAHRVLPAGDLADEDSRVPDGPGHRASHSDRAGRSACFGASLPARAVAVVIPAGRR